MVTSRHVYAEVTAFKSHLQDAGVAADWTSDDARMLAVLEAVSRRVDEFCDRSQFGSGFGPRIGTNRYDGNGTDTLSLNDDLLTLSSVAVLDETGGASVTFTDETDFYKEPYDAAPYRMLRCHGLTANAIFTRGRRTVGVVGSWGYASETVTASATTAEALDASETGLDVSSAAEFAIGHTLLIDAEQLLVTAIASSTLTVARGVNGTTAATHLTAAAIAYYRYPRQVTDGTLLVAQRRWRGFQAGLTPDFGGAGVPVVAQRDTERALLWSTVGTLRIRKVR